MVQFDLKSIKWWTPSWNNMERIEIDILCQVVPAVPPVKIYIRQLFTWTDFWLIKFGKMIECVGFEALKNDESHMAEMAELADRAGWKMKPPLPISLWQSSAVELIWAEKNVDFLLLIWLDIDLFHHKKSHFRNIILLMRLN